MSLLSLQRDMRAWLIHEDGDAALRLEGQERHGLGIYQNNYRAQLVACLESSFPVVRQWIGGEQFHGACAHHIDRVPPSSWTLDAYSRDFPATLAWLYPDDPEIEEIARVELALEDMFVAADAAPLAVSDLGDIDWDSAVIQIVSTIDLIDLQTNALAIWSALETNAHPPAARHLDGPGVALIWRQEARCRIRPIDQTELQAMLLLRAGASFGALCREAAGLFGEAQAAAIVGRWLGRWLADGLIGAVRDGDQPG